MGEISFLREGDKPGNLPRALETSFSQALHLTSAESSPACPVSTASKLSFQNTEAFTKRSDHVRRAVVGYLT